MTSLDEFAIISGAASVVSLGFALFEYYRNRVLRTREETNIRLLNERLRNVDTSLRAGASIIQMLIRRADSTNAPVEELQNLGRAARVSVYAAIAETRGLTGGLKSWRFGELLKSEPPSEEDLASEE